VPDVLDASAHSSSLARACTRVSHLFGEETLSPGNILAQGTGDGGATGGQGGTGMWAVWSTSPGKRALHLQIVDADTGQAMTVRQAGLRTLGYLLTFAMRGAGFLWVLFNDRRQTLHDRIANTTVVEAETRAHVEN
jgi:hypothetical protein